MPFDGTTVKREIIILIEAREYLLKNGWCQNEVINSNGSTCAIGALQQVRHSDDPRGRHHLDEEAYDRAIDRLGRATDTSSAEQSDGGMMPSIEPLKK